MCEDCGRLVHNDEAFSVEDSDYYYCQDCYNRLKHRAIKSYYYKPDPIFYGSGSLYMGVELEIDKGGEDNANAEILLDIANCVEEKIYCKHDGSLHDGFEIVSHPMTLEYHETMNWKTITGGDPINIEEKYQPTERIVSQLRFLFGTNYKISVPQDEDESAFWDRMVILPFNFSAKKINYSLLEELKEEKDKIVSYCLRTMSHVLNNNCRFYECRVADEMKAEWRNTPTDIKSFEEYRYKNIDVTGNPKDEIFASDLFEQYKVYCFEKDLAEISYNNARKWIQTNVPECTAKRIHKTGQNPLSGYTGIRFINIFN